MDFRRRSLRIWGAATILALATSALSATQLAYSRQRHLELGRQLAVALSYAAAQRLGASMQMLDRQLQDAVHLIPEHGPLPDGVLEPLRPILVVGGHVRTVTFVDQTGIMRQITTRIGSVGSLPLEVSDQAHFQFQRHHWAEQRLGMAPPALDHITGTVTWHVSRPVLSPDGRFLGMVGMAVDPEVLLAPLLAATPGTDDAAGVFSVDGTLFARNPDLSHSVGRSISASAVYQAFLDSGPNGSLIDISSLTDNTPRTVGFTQVPGYDLVVNVGISHHRLLKQWWHEAQVHGSIQLALTTAIFLLALGMVRAERKHHLAEDSLRQAERQHIETLSAQVAERTAELEQSLAALKESEERFRLIADISPLPLVVTRRADNTVIYINTQAAETFQVPQHEACGKVAPNFWVDPSDRARMVDSLLRNGTIRNLEATLKRANGERFIALLSGAFGTLKGEAMVLISVLDINERKFLEQELARSNTEHERFSYAISHDLQEPLRMVASYLGLVERRYGDKLDADGHDFIAYAIDGAKRMSRMINDLLEYSRVGRQQWKFHSTDLNLVAAEALANLASSIQDSGAEVTVGALPTLVVDGSQIMRVLQNLIGNSLKYAAANRPPRISVQATQIDGYWSICVHDNGRGFDPVDTERLFQVFQRLQPADAVHGSGVGLALCRGIVTAHGGTIWAHSDGLDQGAEFCFNLPIERPTKKGADESAP